MQLMLRHGLSKYLKVAEITIAMVLGSVQDEKNIQHSFFHEFSLEKSLNYTSGACGWHEGSIILHLVQFSL